MPNSLAEIYQLIAQSKFNQSIGGGDPADAGRRQSDILIGLDGLASATTILDYGCGIGRTMPALFSKLHSDSIQLDGCDISEDFVEECRRIYRDYKFRFFKIDAQNEHYDQFRTTSSSDDIPEAWYDYAYSFSVFTHFEITMASTTLKFVRKLLKAGGRYYFTMFRIDQESKLILSNNSSPFFKFEAPFSESDQEYFAVPSDKLAFAAMSQSRIENEIAASGWKICMFHPGAWRGLTVGNVHDAYLVEKL